MAWLGLDIGQKRTGVAISDSGILATPLGLVSGSNEEQISQLFKLIKPYDVLEVIVGEPRTKDHPINAFVDDLIKQWPIESRPNVVYVDETLTSKEAERLGSENSDVAAAQLLLEQYFAENPQDRKENHAE